MNTVAAIFDRYEAIRGRLTDASPATTTCHITSLLDIADQADAFVFDAFGVLNVGDRPIPGAAERLEQLRARGCAIRILSNAASYDHAAAVGKFANLGMALSPDEIITSRDAALASIPPGLWGCIAAPGDSLADIPALTCRLDDDPADYDRVDGFLFLSTEIWTAERQSLLYSSLANAPRPVIIANADLAAPRETGLTLEPGYYGHLLADQGVADVRFFGKPFPDVYDLVSVSLPDISPSRIVMCGDTLHTDILGATAQNWRTVLVTQDGMFAGRNVQEFCQRAGIMADWQLPRI